MTMRYRVKCECGQSVLVGEAQAGATISCGCGAAVAVPMLRELRKLPREESSTASQPIPGTLPAWTARRFLLFMIGLVTVLAFVVTGVLALGRSRLDLRWSPELQKEVDDHYIDHFEPADVVRAFQELRTQGLGEQAPPTIMLNRQHYEKLSGLMFWSASMGGAGVLAWLAVAFLLPKK